MTLESSFRRGADGLVVDYSLCQSFVTGDLPSISHIPDAVLLNAAQTALRTAGEEAGCLELADNSASGSYATLRVLWDATHPERRPYAMVIQPLLLRAQWYLGSAGMYPGPGSSLHDHHSVELMVLRRATEAEVSVPEVIASHRDVDPRPADFTFIIQSLIPGQGGGEFIAQHPDRAVQVLARLAGELASLHSLDPDIEGYGHFSVAGAEAGLLVGVHKTVREHFMGALSHTLMQMSLAKLVEPADCRKFIRFFLTSPVIDDLSNHPRILHGDFGPHNVIVDDVTDEPVLIDFASTLAGPAEYDLASMQEVLNTFGGGLEHYWPGFLEAYKQAGGRVINESDPAYRAMLLRMTLSRAGSLAAYADYAPAEDQPGIAERMQRIMGVIREQAKALDIVLAPANRSLVA